MVNNEPEIIALGLQQFADQAKRLGILWSLHQGTTQGDINERHSVFAASVTLDGDASPITVNSLIGQLAGDTRVFVLFVPPSGAYIIGRVDPTSGESPYIINNLIIENILTINGLVNATNPIMRRVSNEEGSNLNINNTGYAIGSPVCGFTFTAPPSGNGVIHWHTRTSADNINTVFVSMQLREGTTLGAGAVTVAASDDFAVINEVIVGAAQQDDGSGTYKYITGLVPDFDYNATVVHRVSANDGRVFSRAIMWEPEW